MSFITSVMSPLRPRASENDRRACTSSDTILGLRSKKTENMTINGANTTIGYKEIIEIYNNAMILQN